MQQTQESNITAVLETPIATPAHNKMGFYFPDLDQLHYSCLFESGYLATSKNQYSHRINHNTQQKKIAGIHKKHRSGVFFEEHNYIEE